MFRLRFRLRSRSDPGKVLSRPGLVFELDSEVGQLVCTHVKKNSKFYPSPLPRVSFFFEGFPKIIEICPLMIKAKLKILCHNMFLALLL